MSYIMAYMIPPNQGSNLSQDSSLNKTPRENCYILGYKGSNEFLSEPNIWFFSSSKSKFRDQDQKFWLGKTPGKSNPNLTLDLKNLKY